MPSDGASFAITAFTSSSGAEAPAVTPTISASPIISRSSSSGPSMRRTMREPAPSATFARASVFEEFALPITITASERSAISVSASWRLVVAKQRSLRDAVQRSGNLSSASSMTSVQSPIARVVCASSATREGSAIVAAIDSISSGCSTRRMASGASARVPTASSCPA
ncbi:unannotated protein [freshwater metagenome]|uniref:Unannotated protein n=1 Tax=freshwater metagenome TaxID=449393 RepID=A0A6J7R0Q8_9ZZZZ